MTESFKQQLQELIDQAAENIAADAANPVLRSMYPTRSRGQMANEFSHFVKTGCELLIPVLMKAVEQRDDAIWNRFRTKEEYSKVFFATDLAEIMDKELLNILKGDG